MLSKLPAKFEVAFTYMYPIVTIKLMNMIYYN